MRKIFLLSIAAASVLMARAELTEIDGVNVLTDFYAHKTTLDGTQIVGESEDGGTVYYDIPENKYYYYADCNFGKGYVIADNGWVVGCRLLGSETQSNEGVIMYDGHVTSPEVFKNYLASNIHSITPDASRICGLVSNSGPGMSNLPFYCDIDANGNFGELKFLPVPEKDFFGSRPQFCSATWISTDGHTIAGQVIDNRGFFIYPIVYRENEQGIWNYSFPSESLFNTEKLPVPEPLADIDDEYPNLVYPEVTNFMDPNKIPAWEEAYNTWQDNNFAEDLDPYSFLDKFMTSGQILAFYDALDTYNAIVEEYNERNAVYWDELEKIINCSTFFLHNGMALSPDGNWLASSAEWEDNSSVLYDYPVLYYVPYLFNLGNGESKQIDSNTSNLVTYQAFNNGDVISVSPTSLPMPPRSWLYQNGKGKSISFVDYIKDVSPKYYDWYEKNISGEIPVSEDKYGNLIFEYATVSGNVAASEDMTMITAGVDGFAIKKEMYLSYIFTGLPSGMESIAAEDTFDGVYNVYNLQGVKILSTKDASSINSLPHGLYIINGKKILK